MNRAAVSLDDAVGVLFDRVRDLERKQCGPWIVVGTYPSMPGTTPESPPYEAGITGDLEFRWELDFGVRFSGGCTITGPGLITTLPDSPYYRPDRDLPPFAIVLTDFTFGSAQLLANGELWRRS